MNSMIIETQWITIPIESDSVLTPLMAVIAGRVNDRRFGSYEAGTLLMTGGNCEVMPTGRWKINLEFSHRLAILWNQFIGQDGKLFEYRDSQGRPAFEGLNFAALLPGGESILERAVKGDKFKRLFTFDDLPLVPVLPTWRDQPPLL
jgi:hypothetical protein